MIALDTNVLVYAEDVQDEGRARQARSWVAELNDHGLVIPVQCLGELFRVLTGKAKWSADRAILAVEGWRALADVIPTTEPVLTEAMAINQSHGYQMWDAIILAAAHQAGCSLLLSEDLHDGFVHRGLTIANPFAATLHPLLSSLRQTPPGQTQ